MLLGNNSLFLEIVLFISNEIIFQIEIGKTEVLVISLKWSAVELIWGGADAHAVYALFFISNIFIFFVCLYFCGYAWKELIDFNGFCVILKKKMSRYVPFYKSGPGEVWSTTEIHMCTEEY